MLTFTNFELMKKVSVLFFFSVYLLFATDLKELLKVNKLVVHYYVTKESNPSISFFRFLEMHYLTDDANTKDNEQDNQLPFKSVDTIGANSAYENSVQHFTTLIFQAFPTKCLDYFVNNDFFAYSNFPNLVWHPPQIS